MIIIILTSQAKIYSHSYNQSCLEGDKNFLTPFHAFKSKNKKEYSFFIFKHVD